MSGMKIICKNSAIRCCNCYKNTLFKKPLNGNKNGKNKFSLRCCCRKDIWQNILRIIFINVKKYLPLILLFIITFMIALPIFCQSMVYSKYYAKIGNKTTQFARLGIENELRYIIARKYLDSVSSNLSGLISSSQDSTNMENSDNDLSIGIITMARKETGAATTRVIGFLTQTLASIHSVVQSNNEDQFNKIHLFICNVDATVGRHTELQNLSKIVEIYNRFEKTNETAAAYAKRFEKEKDDYVYCLNLARKHTRKYAIVIQDDVIVYENFLQSLAHQLGFLKEKHLHQPEKELTNQQELETRYWFSIKLFYPEKWSGFENDFRSITEYVALSVVGGSVFILIYNLYKRLKRIRTTSSVDLLVIFLWGATYFTLAAILIGRQHILSWLRYVTSLHRLIPAPDCCIPAEMYNAPALGGLLDYLNKFQCNETTPVDLAIDNYAREMKLTRFLVEPNICQHIGFVSTLHTKTASEFLFH